MGTGDIGVDFNADSRSLRHVEEAVFDQWLVPGDDLPAPGHLVGVVGEFHGVQVAGGGGEVSGGRQPQRRDDIVESAGYIVEVGQIGDLLGFPQPAGAGGVDVQHIAGLAFDQRAEAVATVQKFPGADRDRGAGSDLGQKFD